MRETATWLLIIGGTSGGGYSTYVHLAAKRGNPVARTTDRIAAVTFSVLAFAAFSTYAVSWL